MIDDLDRRRLADLAMRALDAVAEDYDDAAELVGAVLVFEVKAPDDDGNQLWHGHYEAFDGQSPHHTCGLLVTTASDILANSGP